jgi:hypothetical protein
MKPTAILEVILLVAAAAGSLAGCANRQVVESAFQQSLVNNELLAKEHAKVSEALARNLSAVQDLTQGLGAMLQSDCTRSNQGVASYAQARKDAVAYKLRSRLDDAAYAQMDEFTAQFNDSVAAPMQALNKRFAKELTDLQAPAFADDLRQSVKISEKKMEMTGTALSVATKNIEARDRQFMRLVEVRKDFAALVDAKLAALPTPAADCEGIAAELAAAAAALTSEIKSVADHQTAVANLYGAQQQNLEILRQYTNRLSIYKLVIAGASDGALDQVRKVSDKVTSAVAGVDARLDALLGRVQSQVTKGIEKFDAELKTTADSLEMDLATTAERSAAVLK